MHIASINRALLLSSVFLGLLLPLRLASQTMQYTGRLRQCDDQKEIAFAHIFNNKGKLVAVTDVDGRFALDANPGDSLQFSALGFEPVWITSQQKIQLNVCLQPSSFSLSEVVVAAEENPAHHILRKLQENAAKHRPSGRESYQYTTYDRFVAGFDTNTTLRPEAKAFAGKRELMVMETVSEKYFLAPSNTHEVVVASQISGFKDPVLFFLMSQWQATDFYEPRLMIAGEQYVNPISRGSLSAYHFLLESAFPDATGDTIYSIRFYPFANSNFKGLSGRLLVHGRDWAIMNVTAVTPRNAQGIETHIQQLYQKLDAYWFPKQLQTKLTISSTALGSMKVQGFGTSYLENIRIDQPIDKQRFRAPNLEVSNIANNQDAGFWEAVRPDSLSPRLQETYRFMDSLGQQTNFDLLLRLGLSLAQTNLPIGVVDVQLSDILVFNDYEGFKPGLKLRTNELLSKRFSITAATAFASRVSRWTYQFGLELPFGRHSSFLGQLQYVSDHFASGAGSIPEPHTEWLDNRTYRQYFINRMDFHKGLMAGVSWYPHSRWQIFAGGKSLLINPLLKAFDTLADVNNKADIHTDEWQLMLRYAAGEKQMLQNRQRMVIKEPDFYITASLAAGQLRGAVSSNYQKLELRSEKSWQWNYFGKTTLRLEAAHAWGLLPYPLLFNLPATFRPAGIYAPFSFGTMRMNEFMASRHVMLFWSHSFGSLLFQKGRFAPNFMLVSSLAFADVRNQIDPQGNTITAPRKGYFESGLVAGNLLKIPFFRLGIGLFHRYGPYRLPRQLDNFSVKLFVGESP